MPIALSPQNPRLGRARELLEPRGRREQGRFLIEGPTLLGEARRSGIVLEALYAGPGAVERYPELIATAEAAGVATFLLPDRALARISDVATPAGLIAEARLPAASAADVLARSGVVLLLAGIADPGNAGTLIRSAEAFGAAGVLTVRGGVDPFAPKVIRAAMGSLFRLPVATIEAADLDAAAAAAGRAVVVADVDGEPLAQAIFPPNPIVAVGNERHGPGAFVSRRSLSIRIEQTGPAESLNAAVAGSLLLYAVSQRA